MESLKGITASPWVTSGGMTGIFTISQNIIIDVFGRVSLHRINDTQFYCYDDGADPVLGSKLGKNIF